MERGEFLGAIRVDEGEGLPLVAVVHRGWCDPEHTPTVEHSDILEPAAMADWLAERAEYIEFGDIDNYLYLVHVCSEDNCPVAAYVSDTTM